jgi:protease-4
MCWNDLITFIFVSGLSSLMEPLLKKRPERPSGTFIMGTGVVLVLAFVVLIGLFFVFSAFTPQVLGKCVAVVNIDAPIMVEGSQSSLFSTGSPGSEEIADMIDSINKREDVGAVLFVVNSPGGSVVATREIYSAVKTLDKPKVAYFREVAASGAYYISTGTDYIVSDPDAITGSIGVITTVTDMSGLFEKLGINVTEVKSGPHKDIGSSFRNMTPEESAIMQNLINEVYGEFRSVVIENRKGKLDMNNFENITDGRIMSGRQALKAGLVDALGNKKDAIMKAAELGNITAMSVEDVRLCPISVGNQDAGLFSMEGLIRSLTMRTDTPALSYK